MDVLIIKPGALGDTLMLVPALASLKGKVRPLVAGREPGLSFLQEWAMTLSDFESRGWQNLFTPWETGSVLPVVHADIAVVFLGRYNETAAQNLMRFFPGAPVHAFSGRPESEARLHAAEHVAQCLCSSGLPVSPQEAMELATTRPLLSPSGFGQEREWFVFHPGSGGLEKNLQPAFWIGLLDSFLRLPDLGSLQRIILLGPAEERLFPLFASEAPRLSATLRICFSSEALKRLLQGAALFVGHDSGVSHLSAMLGTPTLALFRNSDPVQWRPLGPRVRVLQVDEKMTETDLTGVVVKGCRSLLQGADPEESREIYETP